MSRLRLKPSGSTGRVHHVTPQSAGWSYVGFDLYKLAPGERLGEWTGHREVCLVLISGKAQVEAGNTDFGEIGSRMSPFEGEPFSVYAPAGVDWSVEATTALELAVCSSPGVPDLLPPRLITPDTHPPIVRGKGSNTRQVTNILPEDDPANSLLVVEVISPNGNSSSYPPHKHDTDDLPRESLLEESYYHRLNPPQGFGFQRVYTDDRSSTRPSPSRTATSCWCRKATTRLGPCTATTAITSTSWPARAASGNSTTRRSMSGC